MSTNSNWKWCVIDDRFNFLHEYYFYLRMEISGVNWESHELVVFLLHCMQKISFEHQAWHSFYLLQGVLASYDIFCIRIVA